MNKEQLPEIYKVLEQMLEAGLPDRAIEGCLKISEAFTEESICWLIASKSLQELKQPEAAYESIMTALHFEPNNTQYLFQLFNVFVQLNKIDLISTEINRRWQFFDLNSKKLMADYLEMAMANGLVSKLELNNEILSYILIKNQT